MPPFLLGKFKEYGLKALPYLALLLVGVALGWKLKPNQVEIQERVRVEQVEKQVVVIQEQVRVEIVKVKDTQVVERWHREKTEEKKPDGTVTTKEVEDKNIDTVVHDRETATEIKIVEIEKQVVVVQKETVEKIIKPVQSNWRTSALLGVQPQLLPSIKINSFVYGTEIEGRVAGPVWLGVWGTMNTSQQATVGIKGTFDF